jgi:hypothetical protein
MTPPTIAAPRGSGAIRPAVAERVKVVSHALINVEYRELVVAGGAIAAAAAGSVLPTALPGAPRRRPFSPPPNEPLRHRCGGETGKISLQGRRCRHAGSRHAWTRRSHGTAGILGAGTRLISPGEPMASGAGHDAAIFANAGVPGAMLFVCNENRSHNPREAINMEDFMLGVEVPRLGLLEGSA